jgi:hypothetical protein
MAQHLFDTQDVTTTGVKAAATLTKFPEFGATASVGISTGSATVTLRAWNHTSYKEVLRTFTLPVASGAKTGDLFDSEVIASQWEFFDWNVTAISGGGTLKLTLSGSGI